MDLGNPFASEDEDEIRVPAQDLRNNNPFEDNYGIGVTAAEDFNNKNPFTEDDRDSFNSFQVENFEIVDKLTQMGFNETVILALIKQSMVDDTAAPSLPQVLSLLRKEIIAEMTRGTQRQNSIWKSPMVIRVGSWLPDIEDSAISRVYGRQEGGRCVAYYTSVTSIDFYTEPPVTWNSVHRFSQFYQLYCDLHPYTTAVFPDGMKYPFCDDRLSTWLFGSSESVCDDRRKMLDMWIREIVMDVRMMTIPDVFKLLSNFFESDARLTARRQRVRECRRRNWASSSSGGLLPSLPISEAKESAMSKSLFPDTAIYAGPSSEPHGDYAGRASGPDAMPLGMLPIQARMKSMKKMS